MGPALWEALAFVLGIAALVVAVVVVWDSKRGIEPMSVRAKFRVTEMTDVAWAGNPPGMKSITLMPVGGAAGGESAENAAFYAATPGGAITLSVVNATAAAQFSLGAEYYVDFTRAE